MAVQGSGAFVGRDLELAQLRRGWADACAGRGRVFLLVGEAGIGKTRLADEFAAEAAAGGSVRTVWGRCWESGGAPPYWPWIQILRGLARAGAPATPALDGREPSALGAALPEQARFQLFDETCSYLRSAASHTPALLVLDDLHAADLPSLLLLRFLARELRGARLLLLGTYREHEASQDPAVSQLLGEVMREGERLRLGGLTPADIERYLQQSAGAADSSVADALHAFTDGNPLFVSEAARLLASRAAGAPTASPVLSLPPELRSVVRARVHALGAAAVQVLSSAAVIGRDFDATTLECVTAELEPGAAVADVLEEARGAGLLRATDASARSFSFSHVVVRDTLYADIDPARRCRLHRLVGETVEHLAGDAAELPLSTLAHHFLQGAAAGSALLAVDYARRAGDRAQTQTAYEEAAGHYERAIEVLPLCDVDAVERARLRCELLLGLGDAQWGMGNLPAMRQTFEIAALTARSLPPTLRAPLLARAALGLGGRQQRSHLVLDHGVVALLEEAIAGLGEQEPALRARLLARLAYALYLEPRSVERRRALCNEAVAVARAQADAATLRWVLSDQRWALWRPDNIEERLEIGREMTRLAAALQDREMAVNECAWRFVDLFELGDIVGVEAELAAYQKAARELRLPWYDWYAARFGALLAIVRGSFEEAEHLAEQGLQAAQRVQHQDAAVVYGTQILCLRSEQGRSSELEQVITAFVGQYPGVPIWRYTLASIYALQGRIAQARDELERAAGGRFADVPDSYLRLPALSYLSEACAFLGDAERAAILYRMMVPYAGRCIIVGFGAAWRGLVDRHLALLALTTGDVRLAREHAGAALAMAQRLRALPEEERCRAVLARLEEAPGAVTQSSPAAAATAAAPAAARRATFRHGGDFWSIEFSGRPVQLKAIRGLGYIAFLLRHPNRDFLVTDLVHLTEGEDAELALPDEADRPFLGDAGEVLDGTATAQYRRRLFELRDELEDAEEAHDAARAGKVREEMAALAGVLAGGLGLGGRSRHASSAVERARVSVTKRISAARRRVAESDEALGRYLARTIRTGTFCSYTPDPDQPVQWTF
ncbi:MAG TPA: AAA family ATPase [Candidatus Limnocylindrales bacterium]|nr:AAA family ATPase [Candidatus Limnocylindrales bacterium]